MKSVEMASASNREANVPWARPRKSAVTRPTGGLVGFCGPGCVAGAKQLITRSR